jgi:hypothetical protein
MKINPKLRSILKPANDGNPETIWKLSTVVWNSIFVIILIWFLVMFIPKKSVYNELENLIIIVALPLFIFLTSGLYVGAKIRHKPIAPKFTLFKKTLNISFDSFEALDFFGEIPFLAWIPATIFVIVFTFFSVVAFGSALVGLIFILSWIIYRAVRLVFIKSYLCKRNFIKSVLIAALYTFLYSGWLYGIVWVLEHKPWSFFNF